MKTIDVLVEELPKRGGWPDGVVCFVQDVDGFFAGYKRKPTTSYGGIWTSDGYLNDSGWWSKALGCDHETAIITSEQYEAALAAKNEGWIEWGGGECPVADFLKVEYQLRGGAKGSESAKILEWQHEGGRHDIIAYRLHKPQGAEQAKADDESDLNECICQDAAQGWNGEGLPPVGCECEYQDSYTNEWYPVTIQYVSDQLIVICGVTNILGEEQKTEIAKDIICDKPQFRPIRSEAERKREAARNGIYAAMDIVDGDIADAIYDAIAAGKIPGVKLEGL